MASGGGTEPDKSVVEDSSKASDDCDEESELFPKSFYENCGLEDFEMIDVEATRREMVDCVSKRGQSVWDVVTKKLDEWKKYPLRVAIIGRSGVGKSTFINTIRGVTAESEFAAETGTTETTVVVTEYHHPQNHQLVFCDLPGVGTKKFTRDVYVNNEDIAFDTYDMYLILTNQRVYEDDLWLAKQIKVRGKKFLVVRTKIDSDIYNERSAKRKFFRENEDAEAQVIEGIREDLVSQCKAANVYQEDSIYLIDGTDLTWTKYDFPRLVKTLVECYPELKRDAFIVCMAAVSSDMIRAKANVLRGRVWRISTLSALAGLIPVPGAYFKIDAALIANEATFYKEQLGLTDQQLNEVAIRSNKPLVTLLETVNLESAGSFCTVDDILEAFSMAMASEDLKAMPSIIKRAILRGASFYTTRRILQMIINAVERDALKLDKYINSTYSV